MLSLKEVQHIAKLARIGLTDEEILHLQKDLDSILEYFETLRDINSPSPTDNVAVFVSPFSNVSREDVAKEYDPANAKRLLDMAPETKDGYLKVKSIL